MNSRLPALARVRQMVLFSHRSRLYAGEIATQLHLGMDVVWECLKKLEKDGEIEMQWRADAERSTWSPRRVGFGR